MPWIQESYENQSARGAIEICPSSDFGSRREAFPFFQPNPTTVHFPLLTLPYSPLPPCLPALLTLDSSVSRCVPFSGAGVLVDRATPLFSPGTLPPQRNLPPLDLPADLLVSRSSLRLRSTSLDEYVYAPPLRLLERRGFLD